MRNPNSMHVHNQEFMPKPLICNDLKHVTHNTLKTSFGTSSVPTLMELEDEEFKANL